MVRWWWCTKRQSRPLCECQWFFGACCGEAWLACVCRKDIVLGRAGVVALGVVRWSNVPKRAPGLKSVPTVSRDRDRMWSTRGGSSIELNSLQAESLQSRGPNRYRGGESSSTYRRHFHVVVRPSPLPSALCEQEENITHEFDAFQ